jgi:alkanesulfonate monooxygenase SsuD/methylene tetrahydromethanopterin reductase-like flavin-dependent oxidoreductase (luciferase family)
MKKIGFLSFGHWTPEPYSDVRTASNALLQSIELAVAAEELGLDGAYFRVHHFARQLGSPFPLLAAVGARTKKMEIGTAVIDMRYENPMYMAEDAGAADIIAGGRLQLGISRGSPEQVIDGWRYFGYAPRDGETAADMARRHAEVFLERLCGPQRPRARKHPQVRRSGTRLALTANSGDEVSRSAATRAALSPRAFTEAEMVPRSRCMRSGVVVTTTKRCEWTRGPFLISRKPSPSRSSSLGSTTSSSHSRRCGQRRHAH